MNKAYQLSWVIIAVQLCFRASLGLLRRFPLKMRLFKTNVSAERYTVKAKCFQKPDPDQSS